MRWWKRSRFQQTRLLKPDDWHNALENVAVDFFQLAPPRIDVHLITLQHLRLSDALAKRIFWQVRFNCELHMIVGLRDQRSEGRQRRFRDAVQMSHIKRSQQGFDFMRKRRERRESVESTMSHRLLECFDRLAEMVDVLLIHPLTVAERRIGDESANFSRSFSTVC